MQKIKLLIILMSFFILSACVQVTQPPVERGTQLAVSSVWDIPTKYPAGSTFSFLPKYLEEVSLKPEEVKAIYQLYATAIADKFSEKGYHLKNNSSDVDFYIGFAIALSADLSDEKISEKFGVTPGLRAKGGFEKGSFLMYVEDGSRSQRIWRGAVQGFVQDDLNPAERKQRIETVVAMVLAHFFT